MPYDNDFIVSVNKVRAAMSNLSLSWSLLNSDYPRYYYCDYIIGNKFNPDNILMFCDAVNGICCDLNNWIEYGGTNIVSAAKQAIECIERNPCKNRKVDRIYFVINEYCAKSYIKEC